MITGWVIGIIVTIIGVGAIWMYYRSRTAPAAVVPEPVVG